VIILEVKNRRPAKILMVQYSSLFFDSEDHIDAAELKKEMKLGVRVMVQGATMPTSG